MDLDKLKKHIESKVIKTWFEKLALMAVKDQEFLSETKNINHVRNIQEFTNVLNNPEGYDNGGNENQKAYYERVLSEIGNSYSSYLYDSKSKYTSFNKKIEELDKRIVEANKHINNIVETSELLSGAEILTVYSKEFKARAGEYEKDASGWQRKLYGSFGILGVAFALFLVLSLIDSSFVMKYLSEDLATFGYVSVVLIKLIILTGLIQITRFYYRNYNASKHLANQTLHKYDVLRALQGVYNTIGADNKIARDELIKTGALTAFQNIESGYITTKEGAGASDVGLFTVLSSFGKK